MPTTGYPTGDFIIYLAAVLTAIGVIWRKAVRPVVKGVEEIRERYDAIPRLERKVDEIDRRTKQLEPNGGSSLYDKVAHHGVVIGEMYDDLRPMVTAIGTLAAKDSRARQRAPRKEKQ